MSHLICKGICPRYRATRPAKGFGRYDIGQRRCQACEIFINWEGLRCPCCRGRLRTVARNKNKCVRVEPVAP